MKKITYKTTKEVSAAAILSLFRRNEWREWFMLRDALDFVDVALFVASPRHGRCAVGVATLFGNGHFYTRLDTLLVDGVVIANGQKTSVLTTDHCFLSRCYGNTRRKTSMV